MIEITDDQVEAAAGILRPNGYDVPPATLKRALVAASDTNDPGALVVCFSQETPRVALGTSHEGCYGPHHVVGPEVL